MSLQQIDDVLKVWRQRLSAIAENLLELQTDSTYQSLTGTGGLERANTSGATEAAVGPALRTMRLLFVDYGLLQSQIDRAEAIRSGLPALFGAEAKLRELEMLLFARSIEVEAVEVPLLDRRLLGEASAAERLTAEELLNRMMHTFETVRDAVAKVNQAWERLAGEVDRAQHEVRRLRAQTALPSSLLAPSLEAVDAKLAGVEALMRTDPLGALHALHGEVEPALATIHQRITAAERTCEQVRASRARLQLVQQVHEDAVGRTGESKVRFSVGSDWTEVAAEEHVQGIVLWLDRLETRCALGEVDAVAVGLKHWAAAADKCLAQDRAVIAGHEDRLATRGELRGRLRALKAKAQALSLTEDKQVLALEGRAEDMLYAGPIDLRGAASAVRQYEQQLRTLVPAAAGSLPRR